MPPLPEAGEKWRAFLFPYLHSTHEEKRFFLLFSDLWGIEQICHYTPVSSEAITFLLQVVGGRHDNPQVWPPHPIPKPNRTLGPPLPNILCFGVLT